MTQDASRPGDPQPGGTAGTAGAGSGHVPSDAGLLWHRFHPVTPLVKGWSVLLILLVVMGQQTDNGMTRSVMSGVGALGAFALIVAVLLIATGCASIAWRMSRFAVGADAVYLRTGVFFRRQRMARLDRIQAIDVVQPLLARILGLAELKIEVAGGAGSAVRLAFLKEQGAQALRNELLARSAGVVRGVPGQGAPGAGPMAAVTVLTAAPGDPVPTGSSAPPGAQLSPGVTMQIPAAPEREVFSVPVPRLVGSLVRSGGVLVSLLIVVSVAVAMIVTRDFGFVFAVFPIVLAAAGLVWQRFAGEFGFRAAVSPDGIRLRHGLLEARAQTVPPGRVQAVQFSQGLLWRGKDWWRVQINVAGYGLEQNQRTTETVLLPVGTRQEVLLALWLVLPDLGTPDPHGLMDAALSGSGEGAGFVVDPVRARWLSPLTWRRNGVAFTDRAVLLRGGRFYRHLVVVPHERTQSLGVTQGPLQRWLGLAAFHLHSTPGPIKPAVPHLDQQVAGRLLDDQARRARIARAGAGPEQWMLRPQGGEPSV